MTKPPAHPSIFHITHVDNLTSIVKQGGLHSDLALADRGGPAASIGMSNIKQRRLRLPVTCHPGYTVGQFVPFYFCPRSVMLYLISRANHAELSYRGGQDPILHLEADLRQTVSWADGEKRPWAFSLSNAGAAYAEFRARLDQLGEVNWKAVDSTDFRDPQVKEGKQAEFLVCEFFPWNLVRRIGVKCEAVYRKVIGNLPQGGHRPSVEIQAAWYY